MNSTIDETEQFPPSTPDFGGLIAADYVVTELAYYAGLLPTWGFNTTIYTAILSTPTENARDRVVVEGDIKNMAGEVIAGSSAELWSSTLRTGIKYNEYGQLVPEGTNICPLPTAHSPLPTFSTSATPWPRGLC